MNSKSKTVAELGIIAALIAVAIIIDTAISSAGLPVSVAIATITVVLVVCQTKDLKTAVFASTTFGILSFIRAYLVPNLTSPLFMKPWISIAPRIVIGFTCFYSLKFFKKIFVKFKNNFAKTLPYMISGAVGVLTNTILVLTMMAVSDKANVLAKIIGVILGVNFLIEFLCAVIIVPTVSRAVLFARRNSDIQNKDTKAENEKTEIKNN